MTVDKNPEKWLQFVVGLETCCATRDDGMKRGLNLLFRDELVDMLGWLYDLGIVGAQGRYMGDLPTFCDHCVESIEHLGHFVNCQTEKGLWANLCLDCYRAEGAGLGWGTGQFYKMTGFDGYGTPVWTCIAGGSPLPDMDGE